MERYKVNLVHFVDAESPDDAITKALEPGRQPILGEAFVWGSSRTAKAPDNGSHVQGPANK
jgi:hypothetical protein